MSIRSNTRLIALVLVLLALASAHASAQVMQSASYRIQSDSVNVGGAQSTSSSYTLEDTTGEVATGESDSASYGVNAGYQQMQETYLALSGGGDVTLAPDLGGVTGGTSDGSTSFTVTTDNPAGYTFSIKASSSPALQSGGDTINDYMASTSNPDFSFVTVATSSHLGFSPEGTDIVARYQDDGANCNTGASDTAFSCWDGLTTSERTVASRTSGNHPSGTATTIRFRVGIGGSVVQPEGIYTATTTVTLLPQ